MTYIDQPPERLRVIPVPRYEPEACESGSWPREPLSAPTRRPTAPPRPEAVNIEIRQFATGAIKLVLEVMDRRRPIGQLSRVALPHIADQFRVLLAAGSTARAPAPSTLLRVHSQSSRPDAAEITVVYRRGERVHAMGARVERRLVTMPAATPTAPRRKQWRWVLVAITVE
ncbi:Rv3235 family protein [Williamsia soli]|uniref:Rv3235 family protein n=1 Tax=Williamsia soli TaxID=364929 RepID=UPI001A9CFA8F|nr:Rv3235 family protein [Williamsia soli]